MSLLISLVRMKTWWTMATKQEMIFLKPEEKKESLLDDAISPFQWFSSTKRDRMYCRSSGSFTAYKFLNFAVSSCASTSSILTEPVTTQWLKFLWQTDIRKYWTILTISMKRSIRNGMFTGIESMTDALWNTDFDGTLKLDENLSENRVRHAD